MEILWNYQVCVLQKYYYTKVCVGEVLVHSEAWWNRNCGDSCGVHFLWDQDELRRGHHVVWRAGCWPIFSRSLNCHKLFSKELLRHPLLNLDLNKPILQIVNCSRQGQSSLTWICYGLFVKPCVVDTANAFNLFSLIILLWALQMQIHKNLT